MERYKVISSEYPMEKGDILENTGNDMYQYKNESSDSTFSYFKRYTINKEYLDKCIEDGIIVKIDDKDDRLTNTIKLLETLSKQYQDDYSKLLEDYENGDVPTCLKVEAETVYQNLCTLINKTLDSLHGEEVKVNI